MDIKQIIKLNTFNAIVAVLNSFIRPAQHQQLLNLNISSFFENRHKFVFRPWFKQVKISLRNAGRFFCLYAKL